MISAQLLRILLEGLLVANSLQESMSNNRTGLGKASSELSPFFSTRHQGVAAPSAMLQPPKGTPGTQHSYCGSYGVLFFILDFSHWNDLQSSPMNGDNCMTQPKQWGGGNWMTAEPLNARLSSTRT